MDNLYLVLGVEPDAPEQQTNVKPRAQLQGFVSCSPVQTRVSLERVKESSNTEVKQPNNNQPMPCLIVKSFEMLIKRMVRNKLEKIM